LPGVDDERVRVELADPPEDRATLTGFREAAAPEGKAAAERDRVPEKPLMLASWIVDVAEEGD